MTTHDWTQDERERAQAIIRGDARTLNDGQRGQKATEHVSRKLCREWRQEIRNDGTPQSVNSHGFTRSAIRKHATGNCTHDHAGIPVRYTKQGTWEPAPDKDVTGYDDYERLGWRYECVECECRDISLREEWLYCRSCARLVPEVRDLRAGELVGFEDVDG